MKQLRTFGDSRTLSYCVFCGAIPKTRDHCPSRIFLDEPYPENLPVVQSCLKCNNDFSIDEEYVACLLSCAIDGTTEPDKISRPKIRRLLEEKPLLKSRIAKQFKKSSDNSQFLLPEVLRLEKVILKLARGHVLHEVHEICLQIPNEIKHTIVKNMSVEEWNSFANPEPLSLLPEVGSRAMQRLRVQNGKVFLDWLNVQTNVYSYYVSQNNCIEVRFLLQNYLACYVRWDY